MNKLLKPLLALMLMIGVSPVLAADYKIGFVHATKLLEQAPQAKNASAKLDEEFSAREQELVLAKKRLKQLEEELVRDGGVMDAERQTALERDVVARRREIKRAQDDLREDFNLRRNQELSKLQKQIRKIILAMAKEEKFDLIVSDGVVYASDAVNVTDMVLERLKQSAEPVQP